MLGRSSKGDEEIDRLRGLCKVISLMDSIRAFRRVKLDEIEKSFKNLEFSDVKRRWKDVKPDVRKIIELPYKSARIRNLIKKTYYAKYGISIAGCVASFFLYIALTCNVYEVQWAYYLCSILLRPYIAIPAFASLPASVILFIMMDYKTRKVIGEYEMTHRKKLSLAKARIKEFVDWMIARLVEEIGRAKVDPSRIRLELYFKDYKGIKVLKVDRGRFIKRRRPVYVVSFG